METQTLVIQQELEEVVELLVMEQVEIQVVVVVVEMVQQVKLTHHRSQEQAEVEVVFMDQLL